MKIIREIQPAFEYDEAKSRSNLEKHGMDFKEAKALWADKRRLQVPVEHKGERRSMLFAHYAGSIWVAIFTEREGRYRIISARRAVKEEVAYYDRKANER